MISVTTRDTGRDAYSVARAIGIDRFLREDGSVEGTFVTDSRKVSFDWNVQGERLFPFCDSKVVFIGSDAAMLTERLERNVYVLLEEGIRNFRALTEKSETLTIRFNNGGVIEFGISHKKRRAWVHERKDICGVLRNHVDRTNNGHRY